MYVGGPEADTTAPTVTAAASSATTDDYRAPGRTARQSQTAVEYTVADSQRGVVRV